MARPTVLSLFSGVGGLDLGIELALSGAVVLGYCERDAYAAATLLARMEDSSLEPAPVFIGDIQNLDGSELAGQVDILCGGFPCQDISVAGRGEGIGGKRSGLWSEIVRLADEIRPRYIFLENVSAIITRGLSTVLADLAALGFDAEWLCLRASDVGAPHRRERWFCLAVANAEGYDGREHQPQRQKEERVAVGGAGEGVAHRDIDGSEVERSGGLLDRERRRGSASGDGAVDDAGGERRQQVTGSTPRDEGADEGWAEEHDHESCGAEQVFPPGPADHDAWRDIPEYLAPAVEPDVCRVVDGLAEGVDEHRADRLRCCGNGVVPLQAAVAFRELVRRVERGEQ